MGHETWSAHLDYILSLLGYSIGIGGFWKFPYFCMRNGGGAFLIPLFLFTIIGALPCVFLEMTIGQYSQSGPVNVWNLCPPFRGIGVGAVLISIMFATYYPSLFAWILYYIYFSFSHQIPWANCDNDWNTPTCITEKVVNITLNNTSNLKAAAGTIIDHTATVNIVNTTAMNIEDLGLLNSDNVTTNMTAVIRGLTAAEEFWRFKVLELTSGLEDVGGMRWPLVGCLAITYIGIFLCMFQGIKVAGKVVYVTVGVPYILVTVLLIRGCLLPGSAEGIYYFVYPKFERLLEPKIWLEACSYALYSLGIAYGGVITMAGHNKFTNNCLRDALIVTAIDFATCIYVGFAFFAIMGHVAYLRGVTVEAFQTSGFNLGFIVYPEALASLPLPQLWSVLTFVMLLTLGIDSLVPCFELTATALSDRFPKITLRRWIPYIIVLVPPFLVGLVFMTQGGMYVLTLVEWYAFFPSLALFATLECFVVGCIYGTKRMENDIMSMWGKTVPRVVYIGIKYICPLLLMIIFCYSLYSYRPPKYGDYIYPSWATGIGWMISLTSLMPLPIIFVWTVWNMKGDTLKEKIKKSLEPNSKWGPSASMRNDSTDVHESML